MMSLKRMVSKEGKTSDGESSTPLVVSIEQGHTVITKYLVNECKADVSGTPLVLTCENGCLENVRMLVEGHDVEKTMMSVDEVVSKEGKNSDGDSNTPLQSAAGQEQLEIVQYLVKTCLQWTSLNGCKSSLIVLFAACDFKEECSNAPIPH